MVGPRKGQKRMSRLSAFAPAKYTLACKIVILKVSGPFKSGWERFHLIQNVISIKI